MKVKYGSLGRKSSPVQRSTAGRESARREGTSGPLCLNSGTLTKGARPKLFVAFHLVKGCSSWLASIHLGHSRTRLASQAKWRPRPGWMHERTMRAATFEGVGPWNIPRLDANISVHAFLRLSGDTQPVTVVVCGSDMFRGDLGDRG